MTWTGPACRVLALCATAGCADASPPPVTVSDSAGVRLTVTNETSGVFAEVDSVPSLSLGGVDVSSPTRFSGVRGVHVDRASRVWVADGPSGEVRIFDADGTHWKTRGGRGEGPGEFLRMRLLGAMRGDSVLIGDVGTDRVTLFDAEGELVRTRRLPQSEYGARLPLDVFPDGSILAQVRHIYPAASLEPGRTLDASVELVRVELETAGERRGRRVEGFAGGGVRAGVCALPGPRSEALSATRQHPVPPT